MDITTILVFLFGGGMILWKSKLSYAIKFREIFYEIYKKYTNKKISDIEDNEIKIEAKIKKNDQVTAETQTKIKNELENTAKKIQVMIDSNNTTSAVDANADQNWGKL